MNALSSSLESESLRRATGQPKDGKDEEMTEEDEDYDEEEDEHSCRNDSSRAKRHANRGSIVPLSTVPDIYGQVHPQETDSLVQQSLHEFDAAVDRLADSAKRATLSAQKKCPELLTPSFKLLFLRCEVFHIKVRRNCSGYPTIFFCRP